MRLVRMMMALMIALSVAMLPAAGSAMSIASKASQRASEVASGKMAMADEMSATMDDCCPHHAKGTPCDHPSDQCPLPFCAEQPVSIAFAADFHFNAPVVAGHPLPLPADQVVLLHSGSPPFRPPRV